MYAIVETFLTPSMEDPKLLRVEIRDTLNEAVECRDKLMEQFFNDYGDDYRDLIYENSIELTQIGEEISRCFYIKKIENR